MAHDLLYWLSTKLEREEGIFISRNIPNFPFLTDHRRPVWNAALIIQILDTIQIKI